MRAQPRQYSPLVESQDPSGEHSYLAREAQARVQIDKRLAAAGWVVQSAIEAARVALGIGDDLADVMAAPGERSGDGDGSRPEDRGTAAWSWSRPTRWWCWSAAGRWSRRSAQATSRTCLISPAARASSAIAVSSCAEAMSQYLRIVLATVEDVASPAAAGTG
jgi:hypothetical protein